MEKRRRSNMKTTISSRQKLPTPYLHDEIVFSEILTKLPVKSLHRFSLVSKLWYNTIHHDKNFIASHSLHAKSNPSILFLFQYNCGERDTFKSNDFIKHLISFNYNDNNQKPSIAHYYSSCFTSKMVGSCNGLICFSVLFSGYEICNPSTQEVLSIPIPLDFGIRFSAFGYDPLKDEYKVLRVCSKNRTMIYTLGTKDWREITSTCGEWPDRGIYYNTEGNICLNGTIHWLSYSPHDKILLFDVHHEKFQVISTPVQFTLLSCKDNQLYEEFCGCLIDMGGSLCLAHFSGKSKNGFEIYFYMFDHNNFWKTMGKSVLLPLSDGKCPFAMGPLIAYQQQVLFYKVVENRKLRIYNAHTRSCKELELPPKAKDLPYRVIYHVENLLSLKRMVPPNANEEDSMSPKMVPVFGGSEEHFMYMSSIRVRESNLTPRLVDITSKGEEDYCINEKKGGEDDINKEVLDSISSRSHLEVWKEERSIKECIPKSNIRRSNRWKKPNPKYIQHGTYASKPKEKGSAGAGEDGKDKEEKDGDDGCCKST